MNGKLKRMFEEAASRTGLRFHEDNRALFGESGGYTVMVRPVNESSPYQWGIYASAYRDGGSPDKDGLKQLSKDNKCIMGASQKEHVFTVVLKAARNAEKMSDYVVTGLNAFTSYLRNNAYENCCQTCGKVGETSVCFAQGGLLFLCDECFTAISQNTIVHEESKKRKKESMLGGIIGALLGSLLGVACIIIFSQLGYVAALSGLVMAVCTLKGYELLGGKLTTKGIVISAVIMLIMTYVGDRLDWAIMIMREVGIDFVSAYRAFPLLLSEGYLDSTSYWFNLILVYVFVLLGAVPTVRHAVSNQKNDGCVYRL